MASTTSIPTSWIWMKGVDAAAIADPIAVDDDRPSVKDLIAAHQDQIEEMRMRVAAEKPNLYDSTKHDDLWLLRFILSHCKSKKKKGGKHLNSAVKAAAYTLEFREKHRLDETDIRFVKPGYGRRNDSAEMKAYFTYAEEDTAIFELPDAQRGPVMFLRYASLDQHGLVQNVDDESLLSVYLYGSEWIFQWLDYITRTTGRLTKNIRLFDLEGSTLQGFSVENTRRDGRVFAQIEDCYPQSLEILFVCNPPAFMEIAWGVIRAVAPKRVIEKVDLVNPKRNPKQRAKILNFMDEKNLPERFGGSFEPWPVEFPLPLPPESS